MKEIVEDFYIGVTDFARDLKDFRYGGQKIVGVFDGVDIFQKDFDIFRGGQVGYSFYGFDAVRVGLCMADALDAIAGK